MPGMGGMALLRHASRWAVFMGIILSSALEDDVVEAVLRMSAAYGLQVLGRIEAFQRSRSASSSAPGAHIRSEPRRPPPDPG